MPFYDYAQTNSGGKWQTDANIRQHTIVEAQDAIDADVRAQYTGIYFHGCASGRDCHCCGDRWNTTWDKGAARPVVYAEDPLWVPDYLSAAAEVVVHYLDGRRVYRRPLALAAENIVDADFEIVEDA